MIHKVITLVTEPQSARATGEINSLTIVDDEPSPPYAQLDIRPEPWKVAFDESKEYVLILKSHFPEATRVQVKVGDQTMEFSKQNNHYFGGLRHIHL